MPQHHYNPPLCAHRNLCERSSLHSNMHDTERRRLMRTVNVEERILQSFEDNPNTSSEPFLSSLESINEASFCSEGVFNAHVWAYYIPHDTRSHAVHHRSAVKVWAGIIGDCLLGFYLLPPRLDGRKYLIFLETVMPIFLGTVPLHIFQDMWFQHDGAPAHNTIVVRDYLNQIFGARWIARGGPIACPPRSLDLSPLDFFGGHELSCVRGSCGQ
ncbi:DUF4817 domain-containing protein [Trichonephila clavipes]|nr:DUF4817 domain-containing protein [Trichonephila clavipes]